MASKKTPRSKRGYRNGPPRPNHPESVPCRSMRALVFDYLHGNRSIKPDDPNDLVTSGLVHICLCDDRDCDRLERRFERMFPIHHAAITRAIDAAEQESADPT